MGYPMAMVAKWTEGALGFLAHGHMGPGPYGAQAHMGPGPRTFERHFICRLYVFKGGFMGFRDPSKKTRAEKPCNFPVLMCPDL